MVQDDLAPGMLLAAPSLHDGNFERAVVLLGRSGSDGALGWLLAGRELMSVRELLVTSELVPPGTPIPDLPSFSRLARVGGPVAPTAGWLIYRRGQEPLVGEIPVGPDLAVSGEMAAFHAVISGGGPTQFRLVLGCAGWAPGQLEAEVGAGAWLPAPVDLDLVFDENADGVWDQAYQSAVGAVPAVFSNRRGSA